MSAFKNRRKNLVFQYQILLISSREQIPSQKGYFSNLQKQKTTVLKKGSSYEKIPFLKYCQILFIFPELIETIKSENLLAPSVLCTV
jgi:hypothetical protein